MKIKIDKDIMKDVVKAAQTANKGRDTSEAVMVFGPDRWFINIKDPSNVGMVGIRVTDEAMDVYRKGEVSKLGVWLDEIENFIKTATGEFEMEYDTDEYKLYLRDDTAEFETSTIDPDSVEGVIDGFPDVEHPVKIKTDYGRISSFVDRVDKLVGGSAVRMDARENNLYLYVSGDSSNMVSPTKWSEFDDYKLNFDGDHVGDPDSEGVLGVYSREWLTSIHEPSDEMWFMYGAEIPCFIRFAEEEGVSVTYAIAPRIPNDGTESLRVPESALEDEDRK